MVSRPNPEQLLIFGLNPSHRNAQPGWAVIEKGRDLKHSSFVSWPTRAQADKALREVRASYPERQWKLVRVRRDRNSRRNAGGEPRLWVVVKHSSGEGYVVRDGYQREPGGSVWIPRPYTDAKQLGVYKRKADADAKAASLNRAEGITNPRAGGFGNHKPGCACAFCERAAKLQSGELQPPALRNRKRRNQSAQVAELRQALRDETDEAKKHKLRSLLAKFSKKRFVARGVPLPSKATRTFFDRMRGRNPSAEYERALAKHEEARKKFAAVRAQYRGRQVGDDAYGAAKRAFDAATREFDAAYAREAKHNPKRKSKRRRRNPDETQQAVQLYQTFHGKDPRGVVEKQEPAIMREDYTAIGPLEHLVIKSPLAQTYKVEFEGDGVILASSSDGRQLYCIGGNQNLAGVLDADSLQKDLIDLGECIEVQYLARKVHTNFEPVSWHHSFGEKSGERPELIYDKLKRRIFFAGGAYYIDTSAEISPGIEN